MSLFYLPTFDCIIWVEGKDSKSIPVEDFLGLLNIFGLET